MSYPGVDERIYELRRNFHEGSFVDCQQRRSVIGIADEAASTARSVAIAEMNGEYDAQHSLVGQMPPPIDASPDEIAWAALNTPPKKESEWRYLKKSPDSDNLRSSTD